MRFVTQYFLKQANRLSFLEIKEHVKLLEDMDISGLPVPVLTDDFLDGLTEGTLEESLDFRYVLRGILVNLAADPDFVYMDRYMQILNKVVEKPAELGIDEGIRTLNKPIVPNRNKDKGLTPVSEDDLAIQLVEDAVLFFRAAHLLDPDDAFATYNYARLLWRVGGEENRDAFVQASSQLLEELLRKDEKYFLAHYELGNIQQALGMYAKATAYYRKALALTEIPEVQEEIRAAIEGIADDSDLEEALYYINRANYEKAIEYLNQIKSRSSRFDVSYYLGVCFENIAQYPIAIEHFEEARRLGAEFPDLYTNLCYSYNAIGEYQRGINVADEGLEVTPTNVRLRYNRAILLSQVGKRDAAIEDLEEILSYADISDELFSAVMQLRELLKGT